MSDPGWRAIAALEADRQIKKMLRLWDKYNIEEEGMNYAKEFLRQIEDGETYKFFMVTNSLPELSVVRIMGMFDTWLAGENLMNHATSVVSREGYLKVAPFETSLVEYLDYYHGSLCRRGLAWTMAGKAACQKTCHAQLSMVESRESEDMSVQERAFCPGCGDSCALTNVSGVNYDSSKNPDIQRARIRCVIDCRNCGRKVLRLALEAPKTELQKSVDFIQEGEVKQARRDAYRVIQKFAELKASG